MGRSDRSHVCHLTGGDDQTRMKTHRTTIATAGQGRAQSIQQTCSPRRVLPTTADCPGSVPAQPAIYETGCAVLVFGTASSWLCIRGYISGTGTDCCQVLRRCDTPAIWQELQHPERAASQNAVARAQTFLADAFTAVWAFTNNVNKGHAPTTQQLFIHSSSTGTVAQLRDAAERSAAVSASTPRMWAWRWRRRWFFKYGKIRTREQYDVEELRRKVRSRVSPKSAFLFHKIVPTFGVKK